MYVPFETVKSKIEENLRKEKGTPLAEIEAENLYKAVKDKTMTFDKAGAKYGIKDSGYFSLADKAIKGIEETNDFIKAAKPLKIKGELGYIVKSLNGFYLLELSDIKKPDMKTFEKEKETTKTELLRKKQSAAMSNFIDELRKKSAIKDYSEKIFAELATQQ